MSNAVFATRCTGCKAKLRVKGPEVAGKKIRCPKCDHVFIAKLLKRPSRPKAESSDDDSSEMKDPPRAPKPTATVESAGAIDSTPSIVSWEVGIGDDKKYHIACVSPAGLTFALKMKDYKQWVEVVAAANNSPHEAAEILQQVPKSIQVSAEALSKATYAEQLSQLMVVDQEGKKTKIPEGKEQADLFAAIKQHLGGDESEEEADAWSVMQTPLFVLSVIAVIGGFFIWFTTICEPEFEASGRRSGMKNLLNWVGYTVGPMWTSIAVGSLAALVLAMMIFQLVKRPIRQVLEFSA